MIKVNMPKAKLIAHDFRRAQREKAFAPWDETIMKQIPGQGAANAEKERQKIRDADAIRQTQIDAAATPEQLKQILGL